MRDGEVDVAEAGVGDDVDPLDAEDEPTRFWFLWVLAIMVIVGVAGAAIGATNGQTCTSETENGVTTETCEDLWWGMARSDVVAEVRQYASLAIAAAGAFYAFRTFRRDRAKARQEDVTFRQAQLSFQQAQETREQDLRQNHIAGANLTTTARWLDKEAGIVQLDYVFEPTDRRVEITIGGLEEDEREPHPDDAGATSRSPSQAFLTAIRVSGVVQLDDGSLEDRVAIKPTPLLMPTHVNKRERRRGTVSLSLPATLPASLPNTRLVGYRLLTQVSGFDHVKLVDFDVLRREGELGAGAPSDGESERAEAAQLEADAYFTVVDEIFLAVGDDDTGGSVGGGPPEPQTSNDADGEQAHD